MSVALPTAEVHELMAPDGAPLRLTRYRGGERGPVLLVHGASVWSGMFMLPTLRENFVQHLVRHGFDTWLLDWRASIALPLRSFTLDEAAEQDFPAAVRRVCEAAGAPSVQVVAHCAGAVTFFMALAAGRLPEVRSVVASQIALHHHAPAATRLKAALRLPELLDQALDYVAPDEDPRHPRLQAAFGALAGLLHGGCGSALCHRLTFMYGPLYRHAHLSPDTHARLDEQFGPCNLATLRHLAQMARSGRSQRYDHGPSENLRRYGQATPPDFLDARHLALPITFVTGEHNETYLPSSTEATCAWLSAVHGPHLYRRHVLAGYGHLDTFLGTRAAQDTYPLMRRALEATA